MRVLRDHADAIRAESEADTRWCAVAHRAPADIIYAVTTTGIFCRSGCAARTPLRANVRFFANCAEAAAAGFRPCKRCRPEQVT